MSTISLGQAQRDGLLQEDSFIIGSDEPLVTEVTEETRVIESAARQEWYSPQLAKIIELLLTKATCVKRDCDHSSHKAHADTIIVLDEFRVMVVGSWLLVSLLKHWIRELFKDNHDVHVVDYTEETLGLGQLVNA